MAAQEMACLCSVVEMTPPIWLLNAQRREDVVSSALHQPSPELNIWAHAFFMSLPLAPRSVSFPSSQWLTRLSHTILD